MSTLFEHMFLQIQYLILYPTKNKEYKMQQQKYDEFDCNFKSVTLSYYDNRFVNKERIGKGAGSIVYKALDTSSNKQVAIKQYNKDQLQQQNRIDVTREIEMLSQLTKLRKTQHVIKFEAAFRISKPPVYCIVVQLCQLSLADYIKSPEFTTLTERHKLQLCSYICEGVNLLHKHNVIHRDLKPANILLCQREGKLIPLIGDFGHSKILQIGVENTCLRGTVKYASPDMLYTNDYGFQWDIYSLGLIILEVMSGQFLFNVSVDINTPIKFVKRMQNQLNFLQQTLEKFTRISQQVKTLIWNCLKNKQFQASSVVASMKFILQNLIEENTIDNTIDKEVIEDPAPNFQQNAQPATQLNSPKVKSKISTIGSDPAQCCKSQASQHLKDVIQQPFIQNSKLVKSNQKERTKESDKGKEQKIITQIIDVNQSQQIEEQGQRGYNLNLLGEDEKYQSKIYESEKPSSLKSHIKLARTSSLNFKKLSSAKTGVIRLPNQGNPDFIPKIIRAKQNINKTLQKQSQAIQKLSELKLLEQKVMAFKQIQESQIEIKDKQKLLILCMMHQMIKLKTQINRTGNILAMKFFNIYLQKLQNAVKPLKEKFIRHYGKSETSESSKLLTACSPNLQQIQKQFQKSLQRLSKPMLNSRLRKLLSD